MKNENITADIARLSALRGISGFEYRIADIIADEVRPYADEVEIDTLGNIIAKRSANIPNARKIMIEAHMDEIGLIVTGIENGGFLTISSVGGIDPRILPAMEVTVHGRRDVAGVIGAKPPHLQSAGEGKKASKMSDMAVDVGMSREEAEAVIAVGDSITFGTPSGELIGGNFSGKSLDDRASAAAFIHVMKNIANIDIRADVYAVFAVCEEIGGMGAKTAAYSIMPDAAIAVDVTHGITPDNSESAFKCGSGAIISVGPNLHPTLTKRIMDVAEEYGVKTDIDVDGGDTGTDAWVIQVTRSGIPTALLSIPLKYMHTSVETLDVSDVKAVSDLITFFISELPKTDDDWRDMLCC